MVFMFTSIFVGIAAGVYGIAIAIIGTLGFCFVVILIHFSTLSRINSVLATLQFEIPNQILIAPDARNQIENTIESYCKKVTLSKYSINNKKREEEVIKMVSFEFKIKIENKKKATNLINDLAGMNGIFNVKINFKDDYEKI